MTETKTVPVEPTREMIISALASALEAALERMEFENPRSEHGFDDEIEQAEQALSMLSAAPSPQVGREEGDGWQDISTAPLTGERVLVLVPTTEAPFQTVARWHAQFENEYNPEDDEYHYRGAWTDGTVFDWGMEEYAELEPTHWRPLPPPPSLINGGK